MSCSAGTRLPDGERLTVEPKVGDAGPVNPIWRVQLLAAVDQRSNVLKRGLILFPQIGDGVYLAEAIRSLKLVQAMGPIPPQNVTVMQLRLPLRRRRPYL